MKIINTKWIEKKPNQEKDEAAPWRSHFGNLRQGGFPCT
jgi:hypothetical protein